MTELPFKLYGIKIYVEEDTSERRIEQITHFFERMSGPCPRCKEREVEFLNSLRY